MKPWNPYAMTFHGQPITGQTPPKLVVYGPPLTAQQGAMLQYVFALFQASARLSVAPNPSRHGRLADGTPYSITSSQGDCMCRVWTSGAGAQDDHEVFSGIVATLRSEYGFVVLVNKGGYGAPTKEWVRKALPPGASRSGFALHRAPYNPQFIKNVSFRMSGKNRYIYRRYGYEIGRYGLFTAFIPGVHYFPVGLSTDQKKFLLLRGTGERLATCLSEPADMERIFLPFGSPPPAELLQVARDVTTERVLSETDTTNGRHGYIEKYDIDRRGLNLVYMERALGRKASSSDVVNNHVARAAKNIFYGCAVDNLWAPGLISRRYSGPQKNADEQPIKTFDDTTKVLRSSRTGDVFSPGVQEYAVPPFEANAKTKYYAYWNPASEQINITGGVIHSSVNVSGRTAPQWVPTSYLVTYPDWWYWQLKGSATANGAIGGKISRNEKSFGVEPHYVGDALVMLKSVEERRYESNCSGTMNYASLDGTFDVADFPGDVPITPGPGDTPTSPKEYNTHTTQTIHGINETDYYYTLNNGDRLYLRKYRYAETGTFQKTTTRNDRSGTRVETETRHHTLAYTITDEARHLLAYDPELDLLCYSEGVFSISRDFELNVDFAQTGGVVTKDIFTYTAPGLPTPPMAKLVVVCRGVRTEFSYPFADSSPWNGYAMLSNTGVSPHASGRDIKTDAGFPGFSISTTTDYSGLSISLQGGNVDRDDVDFYLFRGLPPSGLVSTPDVKYIKTPETGAAILALRVVRDGVTHVEKTYVVDSAGLREAAEAVPVDDLYTQNSLEVF